MIYTDEEKKVIREASSMRIFNFYLDDVTKVSVLAKLREQGCDTQKGALSALIRVLLNEFTIIPDGDERLDRIIAKVQEEYIFTTRRNKRSAL